VRNIRLTEDEYKEWDDSVARQYNHALFCSHFVAIAGPGEVDSKAAELWKVVAVEVLFMRTTWKKTGQMGDPNDIRDKRASVQEELSSTARHALGGDG
jgi:uncharacterized linocin/CFP29 family protein